MTAPAAGKQWAAMTSEEKLDFLFAWCTSMDRATEFEKLQVHAMTARLWTIEEKLHLQSH
jgi:hypothetical protein